jgi:hypothetical protein
LYAQEQNSTLERSQLLYEKKQYREALNILEPDYIKQPIKYNYKYDLWSTEEYLQRLYILTDQRTRGIQVLHKLYLQNSSKKDNSRSKLEEVLFNLSLENKNYDISSEILCNQRKKENYPGWDLNEARLIAAQGDKNGTLTLLKRYLAYKYADSPNRILVLPEFIPLHNDSTFRSLMTYSKGQFDAQKQKMKQEREKMNRMLGKGKVISCEEIKVTAETYKKVIDIASAQNLQEELNAADERVRQNIEQCKEQMLSILAARTKNIYYRLTLARLLAELEDTVLTKRVAGIVSGEDFRYFPNQLYWLSYTIARTNPLDAKPFLLQMLKISEGGIFLPQHSVRMNWEDLLCQAFGIVEQFYIDDLLKIAEVGDSIEAKNAATVLIFFQESQFVHLLKKKIVHSINAEQRYQLITQLGILYIPEAAQALEQLKREAQSQNESDTLMVRLLKQITSTNAQEFLESKNGIAIENVKMKEIFFNNLEYSHGMDVSFLPKTILLTAKKEDIPKLRCIRSSIMYRMSDEGMGDYGIVSYIIHRLQWQ